MPLLSNKLNRGFCCFPPRVEVIKFFTDRDLAGRMGHPMQWGWRDRECENTSLVRWSSSPPEPRQQLRSSSTTVGLRDALTDLSRNCFQAAFGSVCIIVARALTCSVRQSPLRTWRSPACPHAPRPQACSLGAMCLCDSLSAAEPRRGLSFAFSKTCQPLALGCLRSSTVHA